MDPGGENIPIQRKNSGKETTAPAAAEAPAAPAARKNIWLDAWHDPVANIQAYNACVTTADLFGDGEYRLLVAGADKKLKVWKGTSLASEHALLDQPCALTSFFSDTSMPRLPALAVAGGPHVFIYRNLRPYYKFTLPPVAVNEQEDELWKAMAKDGFDAAEAQASLSQLRENGIRLTTRSLDFISIEDPAARLKFAQTVAQQPLEQHTCITCMSTMKRNLDEIDAVSSIVLGTENQEIVILQPSGTAVQSTIKVPGVPAFLAISGLADVEYRIVFACRNGGIYTIKNGEVMGHHIELEALPVGLIRTAKSIIVACMNNTIYSFHVKGKKNYSIFLPDNILCIEPMCIQRTNKGMLVSLASGELRIYNEKTLVATTTVPDTYMSMRFGRFGREDNTLIATSSSGALSIKILPRNANLDNVKGSTGPPPEQDIPLDVPKKTKLYVEQTQREREQAVDMHRIFQRDLCKLRLSTARAYVKVLTDGQGPISYTSGSAIRLHAQVQGLGPLFKVKLHVQNTGSKPIFHMPVLMAYNQDIYRAPVSQLILPVLVPSRMYLHELVIQCIDPTGAADVVKLYMCSTGSAVPILSAVVKMPMSELLPEQN
eukprot:jgi/Mesvir1/21512/Mv03955-RA.1